MQEQLQTPVRLMGEETARILASVAETLPHALHAAMQNGSLQMHNSSRHDGDEGSKADEPLAVVDWHQRKAVLQQQLASFQQVIECSASKKWRSAGARSLSVDGDSLVITYIATIAGLSTVTGGIIAASGHAHGNSLCS